MEEINKCPIPHHLIPDSLKDIVGRITRRIGGDSGILRTREEGYAQSAILIRDFWRESGDYILLACKNIYEAHYKEKIPGTKRIDKIQSYLNNIRQYIGNKIGSYENESMDPRWSKVDDGIGTMILIIKTIFQNNPDIREADCVSLCLSMMKKGYIKELDISKDPGQTFSIYRKFVQKYTNKEQNQEVKLYCPAGYTKEGNDFVRSIIHTIYTYFPSKKTIS